LKRAPTSSVGAMAACHAVEERRLTPVLDAA
jgi:hypothetical protein